MFNEHQISTLEWFLKDREKSEACFAIIEINYIIKYIQIENHYYKLL